MRKVADGRVFTGRKAKELKLVDELGGLQDAVREAGKLAGMRGEPAHGVPEQGPAAVPGDVRRRGSVAGARARPPGSARCSPRRVPGS